MEWKRKNALNVHWNRSLLNSRKNKQKRFIIVVLVFGYIVILRYFHYHTQTKTHQTFSRLEDRHNEKSENIAILFDILNSMHILYTCSMDKYCITIFLLHLQLDHTHGKENGYNTVEKYTAK